MRFGFSSADPVVRRLVLPFVSESSGRQLIIQLPDLLLTRKPFLIGAGASGCKAHEKGLLKGFFAASGLQITRKEACHHGISRTNAVDERSFRCGVLMPPAVLIQKSGPVPGHGDQNVPGAQLLQP